MKAVVVALFLLVLPQDEKQDWGKTIEIADSEGVTIPWTLFVDGKGIGLLVVKQIERRDNGFHDLAGTSARRTPKSESYRWRPPKPTPSRESET